jgi:hypothetical protein
MNKGTSLSLCLSIKKLKELVEKQLYPRKIPIP